MWTLLQTVNEWNEYRQRQEKDIRARYKNASSSIDWGRGPKSYPCLVATYPTPIPGTDQQLKLLTAYVYLDDAKLLLDAVQTAPRVPELLPVLTLFAVLFKELYSIKLIRPEVLTENVPKVRAALLECSRTHALDTLWQNIDKLLEVCS